MPAELPVDREICAAMGHKEADLRDGALESAYYTALNITVAAPTVTAWKKPRKQYMCSHCAGVPKKGHICPRKVAKRTGKKPPKCQEFDGSGGCEEGAEVTATRRPCQ